MNINRKILAFVAFVGCSAVVWAGAGIIKKRSAVKAIVKTAPVKRGPDEIKYDTALVNKLQQLGSFYESVKRSCTMSGEMTVVDGADSSASVNRSPFTYVLEGNTFYYRMGDAETINNDGLCVAIDHLAKRVFLSEQKTVTQADMPGNTMPLLATIKEDRYRLLSDTSGKMRKLTLLNERHISCKQYSISYDTTSLAIKKVFMRYTNFEDPLNKKKEKVIELAFNKYEKGARVADLPKTQSVVTQKGNEWQLTNKFSEYQLTIL